MENKKIKTGISALSILEIIFTIMGIVFMIPSILVYINRYRIQDKETVFVLTVTFGLIGITFFILGIIFIFIDARKKARIRRMIQDGKYVNAEITEVVLNFSIQVNGMNPYVVKCKYQDSEGVIHIFKSKNLYFNPEGMFMNNYVKVYVDNDRFKHYYVDIDSILPKVENH